MSAVRSLGDLRLRIVAGKEVASFWDIEKPRFVLEQGPTWLQIDESSGVLRGVPDAAGTHPKSEKAIHRGFVPAATVATTACVATCTIETVPAVSFVT